MILKIFFIMLLIIVSMNFHSTNEYHLVAKTKIAIDDSNMKRSKYFAEIVPSKYSVAIPRGSISIKAIETGEKVFVIEDCYEFPEENSRILHIDLDKNGSEEVIVYGKTGGTAGFTNIFIFNFEKSFKPLFSIYAVYPYDETDMIDKYLIDNGEFIEMIMGSSVGYGASKEIFYYTIRYNATGVEIILDSNNETFLDIANECIMNLKKKINQFKASDCSKEAMKFPFTTAYLQYAFLGKNKEADDILTKYYPCKDKNSFIKSIKEEFEKVLDVSRYAFNEKEYQ